MTTTAAVAVDIDGRWRSFVIVFPSGTQDMPERVGDVARLLAERIEDTADVKGT